MAWDVNRMTNQVKTVSFLPLSENDRAALKLKNETWKSAKQVINQNQAWKRMEMCEATSKCVKKVFGMWSGENEIFIYLKIEVD